VAAVELAAAELVGCAGGASVAVVELAAAELVGGRVTDDESPWAGDVG